jgi:hypothetical protein
VDINGDGRCRIVVLRGGARMPVCGAAVIASVHSAHPRSAADTVNGAWQCVHCTLVPAATGCDDLRTAWQCGHRSLLICMVPPGWIFPKTTSS